MNFGCSQNEDGMRRRLFECFEERVEGRSGKHVNFIDDVDFVFPLRGREVDFVAQVADIVNGGVGGCVDFDEVKEAILVDSFAVVASIVGTLGRIVVEAVDSFRKQASNGRLACTARPGK